MTDDKLVIEEGSVCNPHKETCGISKVVFYVSFAIAGLFVLWGAISPGSLNTVFNAILGFTIDSFGWLYLLAVLFFLLFAAGIALSKYGDIKLGKDDDEPEYSDFAWLAMLFTSGMGIGLTFWSIAEPITHYINPPFGEGGTTEAAELGMRYVFFHWGLHAWGIFTLVGLALAYFQFRRGMPGLISSVFYPILGDRIHGPIGNAIDVLAVLATVFGLGTSLGLGALQINSGLSFLFNIPNTGFIQVLIIAFVALLFTGAAVTGIEKGIEFIAKWTVYFALGLMAFMFIFGPTTTIFDILVSTTGSYLNNFFAMSLWTDAIEQKGWGGSWTIFYWAWWIAWGPFVGQFVARISKGRTVRQFVAGALIAPTVFSFVWLAAFGATALNLEIFHGAGIADAVNADLASAVFVTLSNYPIAMVTSIVAIILVIGFFVTSADAGTFVLGMLTSNGSMEPSGKVKGVWGATIAGVAAILLITGGLTALQTASIAAAFPFMFVILAMCYSLLKALKEDHG
ncbi:BCCT family transporter [Methanolobus vulcani]|uniref:BCCT family transporter n=1 Tax=Methanolobus vulcani TaxID=38026 RepID=A0A7Z8KMV8_9EURY|nr:BCCT family transporter [Methanolobus vulcani]TQD25075.1 BCCT family transporter [Methanolobus vulcani]